ncbi:MAG: hypothetical protein ABI726_02805 [bacterium]
MSAAPERGRIDASSGVRGGAVAIGLAAVAVICCAAWPLLVALLGGIGFAATLGAGAGVWALTGAGIGGLILRRQRRARETSHS